MAHHNFYQSLGLDRDKDAAVLASEIDQRLAAGNMSNAARDELEVARQVVGDPRRRQVYDAKLSDPNAPEINVSALRELAKIDFGPAPTELPTESVSKRAPESAASSTPTVTSAEATETTSLTRSVSRVTPSKGDQLPPKPKNKPKQYFPETDPNAEAVTPPPSQPAYQPGYQQPYPPAGYPAPPGYPYPAPYPAPYYPPQYAPAPAPAQSSAPEEKKGGKGTTVALVFGVILALAAIGGGGWWLYDNQGQPWAAEDQALADAFPAVVSSNNGGRGWNNLKCKSMPAEEGQKARVRCANEKVGVSIMDYGSEPARDAVLPDSGETTLESDQCQVRSFELEGAQPPAFMLAPKGSDARYLVLINGDDAKQQRTELDLCQ